MKLPLVLLSLAAGLWAVDRTVGLWGEAIAVFEARDAV